ncbi:MAG: hypothetical protein SXA11_09970 [Cyanobacteriota bacterium]|nr:hypothetical protein [Cyanobacteriota bacterium]
MYAPDGKKCLLDREALPMQHRSERSKISITPIFLLGQSIWILIFVQSYLCLVNTNFFEVNLPNYIQEIIAFSGAKHLDFNPSAEEMDIYSQMLCPYKIFGIAK